MNETGKEADNCALAQKRILASGIGPLQAEHNRLSAYLRDTSTAGTPERHNVILTHRALTDFLGGNLDTATLQTRLAEIERGIEP